MLLTARAALGLTVGPTVGRFAATRTSSAAMSAGASKIPTAVEAPISLSSVLIEPKSDPPESWSGDLLVVSFWEPEEKDADLTLTAAQSAIDAAYDGALADLIEFHEFKGKAGSSAVIALPKSMPARRLAVVGLGKADGFKAAGAAKLGAALATMAKDQKVKTMAAVMPEASEALQVAAVESLLLGLSPDTRYKSKKDADENKPPPLVSLDLLGGGASASAIERARKMASGILLTRGLVGSPANYLTPTTMAATAQAIADDFGTMSLQVLERDECEARGMGAYLGVSQGAIEPPKFIHLTYSPSGGKASKKLCLVGKGLTFDSGGYNIKAGAGSMIEKMKFDMGGAGAVLGAARAIAELAPSGVDVHFIIAACENMVSAEAMRPGDILTASNGKTIEVLNTDAEGRLTLADALVYADGLGDVDCIVDIATLTGACIVALGPDYGAVYTDDEDLLTKVTESASSTGELWWRMPLAPEYAEQLKSPIADLANLGAPGGGGSITAALFLKEFIKDKSPDAMWAHMDIAGPVWNDKKGGATGYAVRTLVGVAESFSS
jgi:leucyl aminopeptidase